MAHMRMLTSKALLDAVLHHRDTTINTPSFLQLLITELYRRDKRLTIDIDAVAFRDEYDSYNLSNFLQENDFDIDVEEGIVRCKSIYDFYCTLQRMFEVIKKDNDAHKVKAFVAFLEERNPRIENVFKHMRMWLQNNEA